MKTERTKTTQRFFFKWSQIFEKNFRRKLGQLTRSFEDVKTCVSGPVQSFRSYGWLKNNCDMSTEEKMAIFLMTLSTTWGFLLCRGGLTIDSRRYTFISRSVMGNAKFFSRKQLCLLHMTEIPVKSRVIVNCRECPRWQQIIKCLY